MPTAIQSWAALANGKPRPDAATPPRAPVMEPEVARAQVMDALEARVSSGDARWLDQRRSRIALADGSRWRLDTVSMTRLA